MRRRALIVQNHPEEGPGRLPVALTEAAVGFELVHAYDAGVPNKVDRDALVVLGGPMGVYETDEHPVLADELELIAAYASESRPVLGICLGAQLAAAALGGDVRATDSFEAGWAPVQLTDVGRADPVSAPLQAVPAVFHLHGDTYSLPPGADRLASSPAFTEQAFRTGSVVGFQFHIEVTPDDATAWLETNSGLLADHGLDAAKLSRAPPGTAAALDRVLERVALFLDGRLPGRG